MVRIQNLEITNILFKKPDDIEEKLVQREKEYLETCENIEVWCNKKDIMTIEEYFPNEFKEQLEDGHYIMHLHVPPNERLWKALLLSFGNRIKILKPDYFKDQMIETAKKFLSNYDI